MRVTTRFGLITLCATALAAPPSIADDTSQAHIVGYRCEAVRGGDTSAGVPGSIVFACQIGDDAEPFTAVRLPLNEPTPFSPTLDSLLNLLSTLDKARHEASLKRRDAVVPRPTP